MKLTDQELKEVLSDPIKYHMYIMGYGPGGYFEKGMNWVLIGAPIAMALGLLVGVVISIYFPGWVIK